METLRHILGGFRWQLVLLLGASCAKAIDPGQDGRRCVTWKDDVAQAVSGQCTSCHSGETPAGGYDLGTYLHALGRREGSALMAKAGDRDSPLLMTLRNAPSGSPHAAPAELQALLEEWVVACRVSYFSSSIHEGGILNPEDGTQFHGQVLRQSNWNFARCSQCHGDDFSGGKAGVSCRTCHEEGPQSCSTCHAGPPTSGAHLVHRQAPTTHRPAACVDCHRIPNHFQDTGHVFDDAGVPMEHATVVFGARAFWGRPDGGSNVAPPMFSNGGCSNVSCHGGALEDPAATLAIPRWEAPRGTSPSCTRCHGQPPASHKLPATTQCGDCHARVARNGVLLSTELHMDGRIDLGDGSGGCTACHSGPETVPFLDRSGSSDTSRITVGLHDAHLHPRFGLSAPMTCGDCHLVPSTTLRGHPGHDGPASVFPDGGTGLAWADHARPAWEREGAGCSNIYCHGGGQKLLQDRSPTVVRTQHWLDSSQMASRCGACHGAPPTTQGHTSSMTLRDCATCHAATVDPYGNIIPLADGGNAHINGKADMADGGARAP